MAVGMTTETRHGRICVAMSDPAVTLPRIQSMMVVTSPMGDQAPPLLAAMTITLAKTQRSLLSSISRRMTMIMMIVVVMLSSAADMKKVIRESSHSSLRLRRVVMCSVMTLKPPCMSMSSTIVMAPIRKIRISHVSPRWSISSCAMLVSWPQMLKIVQMAPHISRAMAALLIFTLCSSAMKT